MITCNEKLLAGMTNSTSDLLGKAIYTPQWKQQFILAYRQKDTKKWRSHTKKNYKDYAPGAFN